MFKRLILVFSAFTIFLFLGSLVSEIISMLMSDAPFSFSPIGRFFSDRGLSLLVGLIGIYVTRTK